MQFWKWLGFNTLLVVRFLWHAWCEILYNTHVHTYVRTHARTHTYRISSRLNARWQIDWNMENQAKNLNSTTCSNYQRAFSPLDPTAVWHSHPALAIYMFVIVNFDALAQASDFLIERRQVVFLCWMQDSNPEVLWNRISSRLNAHWQTD